MPAKNAEENPWYMLATLYGVPGFEDRELRAKNTVAWNRYFAENLDEETRTKLIDEKRHPAEELTPFSPEDLKAVGAAFVERCKASGKKLALPDSSDNINFSNVEFDQDALFQRYLFSKSTSFQGSSFSSGAIFDGATFAAKNYSRCATFSFGASFERAAVSVEADFARAIFSGEASFECATFSGGASFGHASFSDGASFGHATFSGEAYFKDATFSGCAFFGGATFSGGAFFGGATFSGLANFYGATFSVHTDFDKATFGRMSSFVNAEMEGETSFEGAIFESEPPRFFGAKLHQGTVWRGIDWPPKPKDMKEAGAFIDAYACLKLEMDRLKKHEDELDFFALEMQSRRVLLGPRKGLPIALYGLFSDYGRSYLRPLVALCMVVAIGAGAFWYFDARAFWEAPGLSAANTLNVFGFRKDFFDAPTIEGLPALLKILAAVQTILGAILLFLFGLGIRNKFRMK